MALVLVAAFHWAPPAEGFQGDSSRILFFHVPMAWVSFVAFMAAGVSVELGLVFAVLATVTGAFWARIEWGAWWNWDPRQSSIVVAMLYYAAYLALRGSVTDQDSRGRLAAAYATLGLVVAPFFYFVLPRLGYSLHPEPVVNAEADPQMDRRLAVVLLASSAGFTAVYFWMHRLRVRLARAEDRLPEGTR
jgi:heme exporter protein C